MTTRAPFMPWHGVAKGPLTRFFILNTRWLGIYLHRIDRADGDRECHDHPWSFLSIVLRGGYHEERRARDGAKTMHRRRWLSIAYRHFSDAHRIAVIAPNTWTLVIRAYDRRTWGFYQEAVIPGAGRQGVGFARWIEWRRFEVVRRQAQ